jgi:hypothetical protein
MSSGFSLFSPGCPSSVLSTTHLPPCGMYLEVPPTTRASSSSYLIGYTVELTSTSHRNGSAVVLLGMELHWEHQPLHSTSDSECVREMQATCCSRLGLTSVPASSFQSLPLCALSASFRLPDAVNINGGILLTYVGVVAVGVWSPILASHHQCTLQVLMSAVYYGK